MLVLWQCVMVGAGGAMGAVLRHLMMLAIGPLTSGWPFATVLVNILGSAIMGALVGMGAYMDGFNAMWRPFLMVGLLGGFTTFSSFSLDAVALWERGEIWMAMGYVAISVIGSIGAFMLAMLAMRGVLHG